MKDELNLGCRSGSKSSERTFKYWGKVAAAPTILGAREWQYLAEKRRPKWWHGMIEGMCKAGMGRGMPRDNRESVRLGVLMELSESSKLHDFFPYITVAVA